MDLWIRSQDNGLFKPNIIKPPQEDGSIWVYIENTNILLGTYKSKERALEVLDEIQNILKPKIELDTKSIKPISTYAYKMPEE